MKYSDKRQEAVLRKLMPPNNKTVAEVSVEESISEVTIYKWRKQAREAGQLLPDYGSDPVGWRSRDKFNAVLESAALSEAELAEYCRKRGIYPEQIKQWRASCESANDLSDRAAKALNETIKSERKRTRQLEKELQRKDAALAETAALLALRKKARAIWGDEDD